MTPPDTLRAESFVFQGKIFPRISIDHFSIDPMKCLFAFLAAIVSGGVNAIASGGTLLTFPVLVQACGLDERTAAATNTIGLVPAALMGALHGSHGMSEPGSRRVSAWFFVVSVVGGGVGSLLLKYTSSERFKVIVPWLILTAALIFLLHDTLTRLIFKPAPKTDVEKDASVRLRTAPPPSSLLPLAIQFWVAVYGGYFGAGIGIMILATLSLMRVGGIYRLNYLKNYASFAINGVASVLFMIWRMIDWPIALSMIAGALLGGFGGVKLAGKIGPRWTRRFVSIVGFGMAAWMIVRQFSAQT